MDAQKPKSSRSFIEPQTVMVRPLLLKPQWMNGLSERLLVSHYENNYGGALRRLNAIRARLASLDWERAPVFEINGLKREELIASGSVILRHARNAASRQSRSHSGSPFLAEMKRTVSSLRPGGAVSASISVTKPYL